jgi:hypothetical protein
MGVSGTALAGSSKQQDDWAAKKEADPVGPSARIDDRDVTAPTA